MFHKLMLGLGVAVVLSITASAQFAHNPTYATNPSSPIPPSGTGGGACGSAANTFDTTIVTSFVGSVGRVSMWMILDHTYVADLYITLIHNGISVVITNGLYSDGSLDYHGEYDIFDAAPTSINSAPAGPAGTLAAGSYRPTNPLSAFAGTSAAGTWTLRICDQFAGDVGILHTFGIVIDLLGTQVSDPAVPQAIPPSGTGGTGCNTAASSFTHILNVSATGKVGDVATYFNMTHTYSADLLITLSHFGVTRVIFDGSGGTGANDFAGFYSFWDTRFGPMTLGSTGGGTVNPGYYLSQQDFSPFHGMEMSGPWALTICDRAGADVGVLSGFTLSIAREGFSLAVQQPSGSANVIAADSSGANIGNAYFNAFTLNATNFPYGWWYGIDIGYSDLLFQINLPVGFFNGSLDSNVSAASALPGPIPPGITVYGVGIEVEGGRLRQSSVPLSYTTVP